MARISKLKLILVTVIPILALLVPIVNISRIGSFYLESRFDPSYMYLTNSMAILCGKHPYIIEHPGTPLSVFGAVVIGLIRLSTLQNPFCRPEEAFITPEFYLSSISVSLQIVIASSVVAFAARLYTYGKSILAVLAFEIALIMSERFANALTLVHPEALMIPAILMFAFIMLPVITEQRDVLIRDSISAGAMLGFGIAVKFTVLPLALFGLLFVGARLRAIFAASAVASFIVWTLPIANGYGRMWLWVTGIATHAGYYGTGPVGLPAPSVIFENAIGLVDTNFATFCFVAIGFMVVTMDLFGRNFSNLSRFLLLAVVVCVVQIAITAKHPAERYMLPTAVIGAVICGLVGVWAAQKSHLGGIAYFVLVSLVAIPPIYRNYKYFDQTLPEISQRDLSNLRRLTERAAGDCDIVYPNEYHPSVEAALVVGSAFMNGLFRNELRRIYPQYVERFSSGPFINFNEILGNTPPEAAAGKRVCVIGTVPIEIGKFPEFRLISSDENYLLYSFRH
jgi:hypothetical protein